MIIETAVDKNFTDAFENEGLSVLDYGFCLKTHLSKIETKLILVALIVEDQNIAAAAKRLGLKRTTLIAKIMKYGITLVDLKRCSTNKEGFLCKFLEHKIN